MSPDFNTLWAGAREQVRAYCTRAGGGDEAVRDEAVRRTATRARRGLPSLARPDLFLSWVLTVARAELCRLAFERQQAGAAVPFAPPAPRPGRSPAVGWTEVAAGAAAAAGELAEADAALLVARAERPHAGWDAVGDALGLPGPLAAARYARAAGRLRAFLLTRRSDLVGGAGMVAAALEQALADPTDPLPAAAAEVFRRAAAGPDGDWRRAGWREDLQAACDRVARFLPLL